MHQLSGITTKIDGCRGLIAKKSYEAYVKIPTAHKRWMDPEDLLQEGLLAALAAEQKHRDKKQKKTDVAPAKYITYLFKSLNWRFSKIQSSLRQGKRVGNIAELDFPSSSAEDKSSGLAWCRRSTLGALAQAPNQESNSDCVGSFTTLCRVVSEPAMVVLVRGLLFGDVRSPDQELCDEIGEAASKLQLGFSVFRPLVQDEKIRQKALTSVAENVMIGLDTEAKLRCLECVECQGQFSVVAIREERFFVSTMTCRACYRTMQAKPPALSCFGKPKQSGSEGYSEQDVECKIHCPDRAICRKLTQEVSMSDSIDDELEEGLDDVDFSDVEGTATAKVTKKKKKKAKPEKVVKAKAAKPAKAKSDKAFKFSKLKFDDSNPPKEVGWRWPFKNGSCMRYIFQQMLKGCNAKALQAEIEPVASWKLMLSIFRGGLSGAAVKTHSWKLNEEGGRFKIYDVKCLVPAPKEGKSSKSKGEVTAPAPKSKSKKLKVKSKKSKAAEAA